MKLPKSSKLPKKPRLKPRFLVRRVTGDSMLPTFKPGRVVLATSHYTQLMPGDVVIIRHGGLEKIKRIQQIRADHIFVAGDNQTRSTDSRSFGWLHTSAVAGVVVWPKRPLRSM